MSEAKPSPNLYLFHGEDSYSVFQKCQHWKKEFIKKYGDINVHILEGKGLTAEEINLAMNAIPFLSEKKMIIIYNFLRDGHEKEQKIVASTLETIDDFCIVIFVENEKPDARQTLYKKITKLGQNQEFKLLSEGKLYQWIEKEAKKAGLNIDFEEIKLLAETVGPNLWQMEQEIKKLNLFSQGGKITSQMIEQLVSPNISSSIFKLTDLMGQKKVQDTLKTFHVLIESGEDIVKMFFMLVRQFRLLIQIKNCLEKGLQKNEISQKIKEHPYVIMTTMNQAKNFTEQKLTNIYQNLLDIDSKLKNGTIKMTGGDSREFQLALEKFIIKLCQT